MARYYYSPALEAGTELFMSLEESRHIRVDRIRLGREVILGDGRGRLAAAVLKGWQDDRALMDVLQPAYSPGAQVFLRCCMALVKSQQRLDWVVEKLTEIGVDEIVLFPSARSIRQSLTPHRLERMGKIIREAGKQTGRTVFPHLLWLERWDDFVRFVTRERGWLLPAFPETNVTLWRTLERCSDDRVTLITGPEGDFTPREKSWLASLPHSTPVRLTQNILRSETAMVFGASLLSAYLHDSDEICP